MVPSKYSTYWSHRKSIEEDISARLGISRWGTDYTYSDNLQDTVEKELAEMSKTEGAIYRKKWYTRGNGSGISVDKFEDGKIETIKVPFEKELESTYQNDSIFQYGKDGEIKTRKDLKVNVIKSASDKLVGLKDIENEKAKEYKQEGHIYIGCEGNGYIFLKDMTGQKKYVFEDIDFVVDDYEGDGLYQVINGRYKKVGELPEEDL